MPWQAATPSRYKYDVAESELSIAYADLMAEVALFLGYGADPSDWTASQKAECDRYVQAGVRRFYYPPAVKGAEVSYSWSFLSPVASLATVAGQETYDLPGDLARVVGQFHYDQDQHRCAVVQVTEDRYRSAKTGTSATGVPVLACVRHKAKTPNTGQRLEVSLWPAPDAVYSLTFRYEAFNGKLSNDNRYPLGGMRHGELIVQSCLAVAEMRGNDERGHHNEEFERLLVAAIEQDRRVGSTHFGHMGDTSEATWSPPRRGDTGGTYPITYHGGPL